MKALLIIDMQKGSFTPVTPRHDTPGTIERINNLATLCRKNNFPVIFIQHDGTKENVFLPNTEEWDILNELIIRESDTIISKTANDAFYKSALHDFLTKNNIQELLITGCATDFCVEATIQSALSKDYHVTVVKDAHTTGDRPHLNAKKVIEHYNWIWENMIPTDGDLKVLTEEKIIAKYLNT
ncbi:MAG: cysteine hydrolase family protein [Bacteroidota bacterium]